MARAALVLTLVAVAAAAAACHAPAARLYALPLPAGTVNATTDGAARPLLFRTLRLEGVDGQRRVLFSEEGEAEEFGDRTLAMAFTAGAPFRSLGMFVRVWDEPAGGLELRLVDASSGAVVARQTFNGILNRTWVDLATGGTPPGQYRLEGRSSGGRIGWYGGRVGDPAKPLPSALTVAGVPFQVGAIPQFVDGAVEIPVNARAERLYFLGGLSSYDHGDGWWRDYEVQGDWRHRQLIGDRAGEIAVVYEDGTEDRVPLIFGYTLWWHADFDATASGGPYLEPFASNADAAERLRAALALADAYPDPRARYVWMFRPSGKRIAALRLVDDPAKEGQPVIAAVTLEGEAPAGGSALRPGAPAPEAVNGLLKRDPRAVAVTPQDLADKRYLPRLQALRDRLYASRLEAGPAADITAPVGAPDLRFAGSPEAEVLTAVYRDNAADLLAKFGGPAGFRTSTPGAPNFGGYQGIGTWRTDVGYFAGQVWARDLGRALLEVQRLGRADLAEPALAYAGRRLYVPLQRDGIRLPPHWTTVLGEPNYLDADGKGDGNQENDGHGLILLAFARQWELAGRDAGWLRNHWGIIDDAANWYVFQLEHPEVSRAQGVLYTESEAANDRGYDAYSNAIAAEALDRCAILAEALGYVDVAARWRGVAAALRAAMARELTVTGPDGPAWRSTAWNWTYGNDALGPLLVAADTRGFAFPVPAVDRATYARQKALRPDMAEPRVIGYGQAFLAQAALLADDVAGYSAALGQLARFLSAPGPSPYRVPEGVIQSPDGRSWYRSGDLGNAVHQAEVLKALALVAGVDDHDPVRLALVPRPASGWTAIEVRDYPTIAAGRVDYRLELRPDGQTVELTLERAAPWSVRLGPVPAGKAAHVARDGRTVEGRLERRGDNAWVWVEGAGSGRVELGW